jgi:hypothetical protein
MTPRTRPDPCTPLERVRARAERPLRIGILCHPTYGGSGVVASELALTLASRGHIVHLFSHAVPPRLARSPGPVQMHVAQGFPYPLFHSTPHDLAITSSILNLHRAEASTSCTRTTRCRTPCRATSRARPRSPTPRAARRGS